MSASRLPVLAVAVGFLLATVSPANGQHPELQRLRVLLVLDTNSNLGPGVDRDHQSLRVLLTTSVPATRMEVKVLRGDDATPVNVLRHYRDLTTGPDETLLFYYSGHGAIDAERGPFLALDAGRLYRNQLRAAMLRGRPGLVVILTDCCSDLVRQRGRRVLGIRKPEEVQPLARWLLFRHRGVVDVTAASPGKSAFGTDADGGFFTFALKELFSQRYNEVDAGGVGFLSWRDFFAQLRVRTRDTCRARHPDTKGDPQTPHAYDLGDPGDLTSLRRRAYAGEEARRMTQEINRNKGYAPWLAYREAGVDWRLLRKVRTMASSMDRAGNRSLTVEVGPEFVWRRSPP